MDYANFVKKLPLPAGFQAPVTLSFDDLRARPLSPADLDADLAAVNSSIDIIHATRGGSWPEGEITAAYDLADLAWHEREFREQTSLAYVVYDVTGSYIGCFYINPLGHSEVLTEELAAFDAHLDWWVTTAAYGQGYYVSLFQAIRGWLSEYFPFSKIHWANAEIPPLL